ncbi:MAG: hypothetical protein M3131_01210 [Actinomycetota bacterium]|nr:hypothetical protein [Actinomycetota bacterium]
MRQRARRPAGGSSVGTFRGCTLAIVLCLTLAAGGCGGGNDEGSEGNPPASGQSFSADHLKRFLLKSSDLPSGYEEAERNSGSGEDFVKAGETREEERAALERVAAPGLEGFSSVTYKKEEGENRNRPGLVALLYRTRSGASKALPAVRGLFADNFRVTGAVDGPSQRKIRASGLGDQSLAGLRMSLGPYGFFVYVWRDRNVVAALGASDILGDMSGESILRVAKRIDFRATR